ncbi:minor capsid protein [Tissierella sp. Yu-01]|uniref:minor capsid protein n=1 Tax=Tissierella sp. Yu-01 TaxID=3035694 RepID=UPI00240E880A|nr:minor capsid protein [Tissierella sp. Yu-01]WFA10342.1 minor capsid protein [Tissierella sp. Yu-01]
MKSNTYWSNRSKERMMEYHNETDDAIESILDAYEKSLENINKEIQNIFNKFTKDNKLTPEKARKYLNQKIPNFILDLFKNIYSKIKNQKIRNWMSARINSLSYKSRITRLEALKESIKLEYKKLADLEIQINTTQYINTINQAYYKSIFDIQKGIGLGFSFNVIPDKVINEILKKPWSGKHFSERIWENTDVLAEQVTNIILDGVTTGKSIDKMTRELRELTNTGKYVATRLLRTETTYIANAAENESYKECGIEKYIFVATLDMRTSKVCQGLDREVFEVSKAVPGENLPPMHPNCRSATRAYVSKEELAKVKRRARDPITGKTYLVPADINYEEWRKRYIDKRALTK